jgi:fucose permease
VSKPIAENSASVSFAPRVIKVVSALPGRSLLRVLVWMPQYWMLVIALCFYVAMEQGVGAWVSTLMEERGFDNVSKLSTSLFWAGQTTGRLTFSWASLRYGLASTNSARIRFAMVHLSVCAASAITLIGFPDPPVALIITFVFGLGCSILFPVIVAFANSILPTATSGDRLKMLTGMLLGASFGAGAFPAVQGAISGAVSVRWSIFCSPVIAALNASLLLILYFRYS